eukprot:7522864-Pyramimonas_sp.AAC.1
MCIRDSNTAAPHPTRRPRSTSEWTTALGRLVAQQLVVRRPRAECNIFVFAASVFVKLVKPSVVIPA